MKMITGKFDPRLFFQQASNVALHVPAEELFGMLSRTLDLPSKWAALVTKSTGAQEVVRPGGTVQGREAEDVLFVRSSEVDISLEAERVATKDGYNGQAEVKLRISILPEMGELTSFFKTVVGSRRVAQAAGIASYLQPTLRAALQRQTNRRAADEVFSGGCDEAISRALADALQPVCFAAGMVLERSPAVRFESESFRVVQQARESAATRRAEHEASRQMEQALARARNDHLENLSSLLERLNDLAKTHSDVRLPDLLKTFSESQRSEVYDALFCAETPLRRTQWIVVAAGNDLFWFQPDDLSEPKRRLAIDGAAGPLRSIQAFFNDELGTVLFVGAATGVYRLPIGGVAPDQTYLVKGSPSVRGGFNAVTVAAECLFATHSELGICVWDIDQPVSATRRLESLTHDATVVRLIQAAGDYAYCSIDHCVVRLDTARADDPPPIVYSGSGSMITALCVSEGDVFAGNSDGDILQWTDSAPGRPELIHRGAKRPAESVHVLSLHGVRRLYFADTSPRIHSRVLGDQFTNFYEAGGQTLRRVEVAPDLIVASSELRDRLFCWNPGKPHQAPSSIPVSNLCGRSVQDVCLVPYAPMPGGIGSG